MTKEDKKICASLAKNLKEYRDFICTYGIIKNLDKEEFDETIKKLNKYIKMLKNVDDDNFEKVINPEIYREMKEAGLLYVN